MSKPLRCSVCPDREAVCESAANPGTYYCSSCANYVAMEYGGNRLIPLPNEAAAKAQAMAFVKARLPKEVPNGG